MIQEHRVRRHFSLEKYVPDSLGLPSIPSLLSLAPPVSSGRVGCGRTGAGFLGGAGVRERLEGVGMMGRVSWEVWS